VIQFRRQKEQVHTRAQRLEIGGLMSHGPKHYLIIRGGSTTRATCNLTSQACEPRAEHRHD